MKKIVITLFAACTAFVSTAQIENHNHVIGNKNITPYHEAQDALNGVTSIKFNQAPAWQNFVTKHPSWGCQFDAYTGMPQRALGVGFVLPNTTDLVAASKTFLQTDLAAYQIPVQDLVVTSNINDGKYINVNFKQIHDGKEVCFSRVTLRFTQENKLMLFGVNAHKNIPTLSATISAAQAISAAEQLMVTPIKSSKVLADFKILPVPTEQQTMEYRLVYEVVVYTQDTEEMPGEYHCLVDANTTEVLYRTNAVKQIDTKMQGYTWATNRWSPLLLNGLPNINAKVGTTNYYANPQGVITFPGNGPISGTMYLAGKWSTVTDGPTGTITPSIPFTALGNDSILFDTTAANTNSTKVNAYFHVNTVHDFMKSKLPPGFTSLDVSLPTRVDRTNGTCNAFYNGASINFYAANATCNGTATIADVVYHEYGHGINDKYWQNIGGVSFDNGAQGEGYADVWAMSINSNPVIGQGFYTTSAVNGIRRYDTDNKVYPQDIVGEVHADGEIIAGAWWDTYINWGQQDSASTLFANSCAGFVTGPDGTEGTVFFNILIDALTYDDNDGNINNGTPHFLPIVKAFAKHGIYLLNNSIVTHIPKPNNVAANVAVPISSNVFATYPAFVGDVYMYYRLKKASPQAPTDSLLMSNITGNAYDVSFPGKLNGQLYEYYFGVADKVGNTGVFAPVEGKFNITSLQRNLPYYLLFGLDQVHYQPFEDSASYNTWTIGLPNDNATKSGKWIIAKPVGSKKSGVTVQTDKDHTSGSGKCVVTGNAALPTSSYTSADVDSGRTSFTSPTFDLSKYQNPVISFWRWFSNSQGTANLGKDLWRVFVSENGGTSYLSVFPDRTYQADVSWRRNMFRLKDLKSTMNLSKIKFMFVAIDSSATNAYTTVEAAVDDFEIYDTAPTSLGGFALEANVYPNPANQYVIIELPQMANNIKTCIVDATGKLISQNTFNHTMDVKLNTSFISSGIYFLQVEADGKKMQQTIRINE
jgi:hypothetical protein